MTDDTVEWMNELTAEMEERRKRIERGGGEARIERQHQSGKMTARERIDALLDKDSFVELSVFVEHLDVEMMAEVEAPGEGVVGGYGTIAGRTVFVFSQDFTVLGGSLGKMHAQKIAQVMDLAVKTGAPVIGLNDSAGAPHSRRGRLAVGLRRGVLPQRHLLRGGAADLGHPGALCRRGRLQPGDDRFRAHGPQQLLHVHHRTRSHQVGDQGRGQLRGARRRLGPQPHLGRGPSRRRQRRRGAGARPPAALLPATIGLGSVPPCGPPTIPRVARCPNCSPSSTPISAAPTP